MAAKYAFLVVFTVCAATALTVAFFGREIGEALGSGAVSVERTEFYAVSLGEFDAAGEAAECAARVAAKGGAGFIEKGGGAPPAYRVLASCYADKADADKVISNLAASGAGGKLYVIAAPRVTLNAGAAVLREYLIKFISVFQKLYGVSVKLDGAQISAGAALSEVGVIRDDLEKSKAEISALGAGGVTAVRIAAEYDSAATELDKLMESGLSKAVLLSARVKYCYIKILTGYRELTREIR